MFDIRLFGTTTVRSTTTEVVGSQLGGIKPRQVLEVLALAGAAPVTKDRLVQVLWGDNPPASAVPTLESYVCVLRRALGGGKGNSSPILTTSAGYRLDSERVTVDVLRCRSMLARAATADDAQALALTRKALRYCEQPLLASETRAGWADRTREEFRQELATACGRASRAALALGGYEEAVQLATRGTTLEPYDESLTRDLMRALCAAGRRAAALSAFLDLRRGLVEELGVEPGPQTRALYVQVLTDDSPTGSDAIPTRGEVRGLMELLRDTLARMPGVDVVSVDRALAQVAGHALSHH
ncbi:MAG: BTAD domain-containing putative transcriptional regulator [Ornithinibacter sp.]